MNLKICPFFSVTKCTEVSISSGVGASNKVCKRSPDVEPQGAERTPLLSKFLLREDSECDPRLCQRFK